MYNYSMYILKKPSLTQNLLHVTVFNCFFKAGFSFHTFHFDCYKLTCDKIVEKLIKYCGSTVK